MEKRKMEEKKTKNEKRNDFFLFIPQ